MARPFDRAVSGFNHNVSHKGRVFHVQTEDSGVNNPTIVTLLYVGGNILASKKTSYAELVGSPNLPELVRQRMEDQHKQMLKNVVAGKYDSAEAAQAAQAVKAYQPGQLAEDAASKRAAARPAPGPIPLINEAPRPGAPESGAVTPESLGGTLFGEDLVSEKSLDEVILGYLAAEKEG
ncbi:MAG TPA: hypothetical protein VEJ89_11865 [Myxococcaceae bacterium]|jgi:hypothetical protein|nr:hypothetical protein [Myxococcaceae bacterium]